MSYNASTFCFSSVCGEIERLGGGIVNARAGAVGDAAEYENGPRPKAPDSRLRIPDRAGKIDAVGIGRA
nr:MAG: hypothetical protein TU35_05375 [Thermoproteus sp. AZ2]